MFKIDLRHILQTDRHLATQTFGALLDLDFQGAESLELNVRHVRLAGPRQGPYCSHVMLFEHQTRSRVCVLNGLPALGSVQSPHPPAPSACQASKRAALPFKIGTTIIISRVMCCILLKMYLPAFHPPAKYS